MDSSSVLLVTLLGAAIAYGSFNLGRTIAPLIRNNSKDEERDGDNNNNNAVAVEGFGVNLGIGFVRFGAGLNLACACTRFGGNYDTVIMSGTPFAVTVSGQNLLPLQEVVSLDSKAEA